MQILKKRLGLRKKPKLMVAYYYVTGFNLCRVLDKLKLEYKKELFVKPHVGLKII